MQHIYGVPALQDTDQVATIGQWSRALAVAIAARDAAIVAATGSIPTADPDGLAGLLARVAVLEPLVNDPTPTWEAMPGIKADMKAAGHGSAPQIYRLGTWRYLRGRYALLAGGNYTAETAYVLATLPAADRPSSTQGGMGQVTGLGYTRVEISSGGNIQFWPSKATSWAGVDGIYWTTN